MVLTLKSRVPRGSPRNFRVLAACLFSSVKPCMFTGLDPWVSPPPPVQFKLVRKFGGRSGCVHQEKSLRLVLPGKASQDSARAANRVVGFRAGKFFGFFGSTTPPSCTACQWGLQITGCCARDGGGRTREKLNAPDVLLPSKANVYSFATATPCSQQRASSEANLSHSRCMIQASYERLPKLAQE